jgi:pyruvate/2-oxoglutarate dehydrogenase complex dihydrolipoamide acyltransferase (E2) component
LTRKLTLLNLLLVALLGAAGWQLRERWLEARATADTQMQRRATPPPPPAIPVMETVKPVDAPAYLDVATKMVFSKDRNPNVVIEAAPPPPEDPVPTFPAVYGVMEIGGPITVFMSDGTSAAQKGYRPGEKVGAFKLLSATRNEFVLGWKDKTFTKTLADLKPKAGQQPSAAGPPSAPAAQAPSQPASSLAANATQDEKMAAAQKSMIRDGVMLDTGPGNRACVPGDTSPAGTVVAGYRKVMNTNPFGRVCYWEQIR